MSAYYNEFEAYPAQWLRNLIAAGHIAPGEVDERSIVDVAADDLQGFTQCHFFAGIGIWSHALRLAGWEDDRPVWTGSCPCQPFSSAGKQKGFEDERHLWPVWGNLIAQRQPATVFGEQVARKDGFTWFDLVSADMEAAGYAIGAADICAAGVGAPHKRQRLYFGAQRVGHPIQPRSQGHGRHGDGRHEPGRDNTHQAGPAGQTGAADGLANAAGEGQPQRHAGAGIEPGEQQRSKRLRDTGSVADACGKPGQQKPGSASGDENPHGTEGWNRGQPQGSDGHTGDGEARGLADAHRDGRTEAGERVIKTGRDGIGGNSLPAAGQSYPGPVNGFWRNADWLYCRDGKWRPVEPGTFPLAHGYPNRVGKLRAYGNAINAAQAAAFIEAFMECRP